MSQTGKGPIHTLCAQTGPFFSDNDTARSSRICGVLYSKLCPFSQIA